MVEHNFHELNTCLYKTGLFVLDLFLNDFIYMILVMMILSADWYNGKYIASEVFLKLDLDQAKFLK